jgi:ATP-dependent Clp protease protease subunit
MGRKINNAVRESGKNSSDSELVILSPGSANDRIVFLSGDVNEHSISTIITQLISLANQNPTFPIYLIISTYGGSIDEMFSLYDTIKFLPCPVHTIALGKVMSAGVLLLSAGVKGKRLIGKNARIMIHPVSTTIGGNIFQVMNDSQESQRLQMLMVESLAKETRMTREHVQEIMIKGHDHYVTPMEAVTLGIVDKIIGTG